MKLYLNTIKHEWSSGEPVRIQLIVCNDSYEPIGLDKRLLIGPNPEPANFSGTPFPVSIEPSFPQEEQNIIMLNPFCFYGRERSWSFSPGEIKFHGYLLSQPSNQLTIAGPADMNILATASEPLVIKVK